MPTALVALRALLAKMMKIVEGSRGVCMMHPTEHAIADPCDAQRVFRCQHRDKFYIHASRDEELR